MEDLEIELKEFLRSKGIKCYFYYSKLKDNYSVRRFAIKTNKSKFITLVSQIQDNKNTNFDRFNIDTDTTCYGCQEHNCAQKYHREYRGCLNSESSGSSHSENSN